MDCPYCHQPHFYKVGFDQSGNQRFRCLNCQRRYTAKTVPKPKRREYPEVIQCIQCGTETTNPKFCSKSCAAKWNNREYPKRRKWQRYCKRCNEPVNGFRRICDNCKIERIDRTEKTLREIQVAAKYQVNAVMRAIARRTYSESGRPYVCQNCGYEKHVEICHVRAIKDFPPETPVAVVSGIDNLIALCPNCHWEFDNGLLRFDGAMGS